MADEGGSYFHLGPEDDHRVPGEVVVKLPRELDRAVTASIPSGPLGLRGLAAEGFGVDALDEVLGDLGVRSIARVHGPVPPSAVRSLAVEAVAQDLGTTYRVRLAADA